MVSIECNIDRIETKIQIRIKRSFRTKKIVYLLPLMIWIWVLPVFDEADVGQVTFVTQVNLSARVAYILVHVLITTFANIFIAKINQHNQLSHICHGTQHLRIICIRWVGHQLSRSPRSTTARNLSWEFNHFKRVGHLYTIPCSQSSWETLPDRPSPSEMDDPGRTLLQGKDSGQWSLALGTCRYLDTYSTRGAYWHVHSHATEQCRFTES